MEDYIYGIKEYFLQMKNPHKVKVHTRFHIQQLSMVEHAHIYSIQEEKDQELKSSLATVFTKANIFHAN